MYVCVLSQIFQISTLQGRVCKLQNQIDSLLFKLNSACDVMRSMQQKVNVFATQSYALVFLRINTISVQLRDSDRELKQHVIDKQKILQRCNTKIQRETDRIINESDMKLCEQHKRLTVYFNLQTYTFTMCVFIILSQDISQLFLLIFGH